MSEIRKIYLIGMPASGKSTISRSLSEILGIPVVEMDVEIEKREGMSIDDMFKVVGEKHFRKVEHEILKEISENENNLIISTGGGVITSLVNCDIMKESGILVYLKSDVEYLIRNAKRDVENIRPLLESDYGNKIINLYNDRAALYEDSANITVYVEDRTVDDITNEIVQKLKEFM